MIKGKQIQRRHVRRVNSRPIIRDKNGNVLLGLFFLFPVSYQSSFIIWILTLLESIHQFRWLTLCLLFYAKWCKCCQNNPLAICWYLTKELESRASQHNSSRAKLSTAQFKLGLRTSVAAVFLISLLRTELTAEWSAELSAEWTAEGNAKWTAEWTA